VNGRDGRNPSEVKLVDGMWTESQRRSRRISGADLGLTRLIVGAPLGLPMPG
jgi:hypothetical protein